MISPDAKRISEHINELYGIINELSIHKALIETELDTLKYSNLLYQQEIARLLNQMSSARSIQISAATPPIGIIPVINQFDELF